MNLTPITAAVLNINQGKTKVFSAGITAKVKSEKNVIILRITELKKSVSSIRESFIKVPDGVITAGTDNIISISANGVMIRDDAGDTSEI